MLVKETCKECSGTGIVFIETSSFFGMVKKQIPASCSACGGKGTVLKEPPCKFCNGEGLIGNEREICRVCNGTGYSDAFRWIPRNKLVPGTRFNRICSVCRSETIHEVITPIETIKITPRWEEEMVSATMVRERVRVICTACSDSYYVDVDPDFHKEETDEVRDYLLDRGILKDLGSPAYQPESRV